MPLLAQSIIGFEDRGRHQSGTRFRRAAYYGVVAVSVQFVRSAPPIA